MLLYQRILRVLRFLFSCFTENSAYKDNSSFESIKNYNIQKFYYFTCACQPLVLDREFHIDLFYKLPFEKKQFKRKSLHLEV